MEGHYHSIEELYEKDANFVYLLERGNHKELCMYQASILVEQSKRAGAKPIEKRIADAKRHIVLLAVFAAPVVVLFFASNVLSAMSKPASIISGIWIFMALCGIGIKYREIESLENLELRRNMPEEIKKQILISISTLDDSLSDEKRWQEQISEDSDEMLASKKEALDQALDLEYGG